MQQNPKVVPEVTRPSYLSGSGIYIHIPFCKQACHYCNFHFSTSLHKKEELIAALAKEIFLRKSEVSEKVETIYFGGGTPSLLTIAELRFLIDEVHKNFDVTENAEITLEANPDDLLLANEKSNSIFEAYKKIGINRLSIGVQSFFEEDLLLMNRAHNSKEAIVCIQEAKKHFDNISIDLIYGIPKMTNKRWKENLNIALKFEIPHLSCYALTVEPKTALKKFIEKGLIADVDDEVAQKHYNILLKKTKKAGYDNYEFSNFGKPDHHSLNNTAYWEGKPYLGIGPSAHSFNGKSRSWNIANNIKYIKSIQEGNLPSEVEILSIKDHYNEYIMTGLRTSKGVSVEKVETEFGLNFSVYLLKQAENHLKMNLLHLDNKILTVSKKGKFLSDGIASDLFVV